MNGLKVEPVGDLGLEVDQHVLGHGVPVGKSQVMELGEGDDRPFDGPLPDRLLQLRVLQQGRQRLSSEARQDERPVGIDPNPRPCRKARSGFERPFFRLSTSGLAHELFARSRCKISFEASSTQGEACSNNAPAHKNKQLPSDLCQN